MKYVSDRTGRFAKRPHYQPRELDEECERLIVDFMRDACGGMVLPLPTESLTKLIERDAEDLDLYADLMSEDGNVDGLTDFYRNRKPTVKISQGLSQDRTEHRLRTTLTHEYGHVKFHDCLWQVEPTDQALHDDLRDQRSPRCKRERIISAPQSDWMEWQAGYISGALLMPIGFVRSLVGTFLDEHKVFSPLQISSSEGQLLIEKTRLAFKVSNDAARVRLFQLDFLAVSDLGPSLF